MRKTIILCDICGEEITESEQVLGYDLCEKCCVKVKEHIEFMQTMQTAAVKPCDRQRTETAETVRPSENAEAVNANREKKPYARADWTYADDLKRRGYTDKEIAELTGIGYKTVYAHYKYYNGDKT